MPTEIDFPFTNAGSGSILAGNNKNNRRHFELKSQEGRIVSGLYRVCQPMVKDELIAQDQAMQALSHHEQV
ncbi:MAG: hypothetical protein CSA68_03845 [Rhodobacterales bacterium]|nr:MAG: hypothetical protein CSA68_03845 [Rhodobacterales bacterium]